MLDPNHITAAQALVQTLIANGSDKAFCVPGESYLAVLDALHDVQNELQLITCRQEGGAANMAEAYGKLTGRPGICFVTRGPGATNASIGVHTAFQDSTPMILFIGQVARGQCDREAFQEVDYRQMFGTLAKWVAQIDRPERVVEYVTRAFHVATSGRPGPVVLALPEDMLCEKIVDPNGILPAHRVAASPSQHDMGELQQLLQQASKPMVILGGSGWSKHATQNIRQFIETHNLPVSCAFRFQDLYDNRLPNYVGDVGIATNPKLAARIKEADVIISVGARLGEMTSSGYSLFGIPFPQQKLVMIHSGAEETGHVYRAHLAINAGMPEAAAALAALPAVNGGKHQVWLQQARAEYETWHTPLATQGTVNLGALYTQLRERLPEDAILCNGAGNYATWLHRFVPYKTFKSQLAPTSGAMGYGLPAAVAAKAVHPDRPVVCFAGDGCFLMNGQELSTAVANNLPIIVLVFNNGMYGTIRMHQERHYTERVIGTNLFNPDFSALARAYGANGETVSLTEQFAPAFETALKADKPTLIEIQVDAETLTPVATLSDIRNAAKAST